MSGSAGRRESPVNGEGPLEDLIAGYIDRLIAGETLDFDSIIAQHPDCGVEIVQHLKSYVEFGSDTAGDRPLDPLGDYTLRRQVGRGGMGVVYEAWQNSLERRVALKVLPAGVAAENKAFLRFMREAKTAAQLNHPNVVAVYGMGVESNTPYYAMEFVEGQTLAQLLEEFRAAEAGEEERKPLLQSLSRLFRNDEPADATMEPENEGVEAPGATGPCFAGEVDLEYFARVATAFAGVADGLQHAHARGIVHRDIKPSNLILDGDGRLRILDFGLARLEGQESLTLSGDFVGTPLYMSPEQARRKRIPVDHRTDIYSLGATLYEMLTWRPPLRGKDHQETLSQIISRDPLPPRRFNPRIPRDLETIVLKCLRKDPSDRYGTAEAAAQDLRRFVRRDPIEARPQASWERLARRTWRAKRKLAIAAVVGAAALFLALFLHQRGLETRRRYEDVVRGKHGELPVDHQHLRRPPDRRHHGMGRLGGDVP